MMAAAPDKPKAFSAPLPLRAIYDERLAGLDIRVLAAIAAHDRMSLHREQGMGCTASHGTLAAEIGCNYINLGKSIKKLGDCGYVERHKPTFGDNRGHVYRVPAELYAVAESESFGKRGKTGATASSPRSVGQTANPLFKVVCPDPPKNHAETVTSLEQYISLSDVRYSAEAEEHTHLKVRAAEAPRGVPSEYETNVVGKLAQFEREFRRNPAQCGNLHGWHAWLTGTYDEAEEPAIQARAMRMIEAIDQHLDLAAWENTA